MLTLGCAAGLLACGGSSAGADAAATGVSDAAPGIVDAPVGGPGPDAPVGGPVDAPVSTGPDAPPPVMPAVGFLQATATVDEFALDNQNQLVATPVTITVVRSGLDLTAPATATLTVNAASTAIGQVHFTVDTGSTLTTTGTQVINFPAQAAGVTSHQVTFTLLTRYNREPRGSTRQLLLDITAVTGAATLPMPTARHTTTFTGAGDKARGGVDVPESVPVGAYVGTGPHCETWGPGGLGTPIPGAGGAPPCGSYTIPFGAELTHPHYGRCNAGMRNDTTSYGGGIGNVLNSVLVLKMFVEEDLKLGSTHFLGNSMTYTHHANEAFVMKFRTGGAGEYAVPSGATPGAVGAITFAIGPHVSQGPSAARFAALTTSPCDFDYAKVGTDPCYRNLGQFDAVVAEILPTGTSTTGKCTLRPNTTYYFSTRWEDPSQPGYISCRPGTSAPLGAHCGTVLTVQ